MYFPLTHPNEGFQSNMNLGTRFHQMLTGDKELTQTDAFPQLEEVRKAFTVETVPIEVESGEKTYVFQMYVVKSKEKVDGKGLRFFLFIFYGNEVRDGEEI